MNALTAGTIAHRPAPAFLTFGFRPFFPRRRAVVDDSAAAVDRHVCYRDHDP
jgi:hypothetical protein